MATNLSVISIKQAVALSGLSENYIRKAISKGDLKVTKGTVNPDSRIPKNFIMVEDFETWRAQAGAHSQREDGRNKYVVYMLPDEFEALKALVADTEYGETLARANQKVVESETE